MRRAAIACAVLAWAAALRISLMQICPYPSRPSRVLEDGSILVPRQLLCQPTYSAWRVAAGVLIAAAVAAALGAFLAGRFNPRIFARHRMLLRSALALAAGSLALRVALSQPCKDSCSNAEGITFCTMMCIPAYSPWRIAFGTLVFIGVNYWLAASIGRERRRRLAELAAMWPVQPTSP